MDSKTIRNTFFDFFRSKDHSIVPSAPIVNKEDPSLMFTNAGMNQFKDYFLGNKQPKYNRIADTQKCLRVTGKHNDLEEVGVDSYHHTMFEMLGNWSFGDYFKEEAIAWAWELLTEVYKIDKDRLYVTVFEGSEEDGVTADEEAATFWKKHIDESRILFFDKKDNFWEMGETGPCGPCSEIHVDLRSEAERKEVDGRSLVNQDDPLVVEIWNLVFIQYNRMANGALIDLPQQHVDTGMGFERLCMVLQGKKSNYETDVFSSTIRTIEKLVEQSYQNSYALNAKKDIAFRVIADHLRAVSFAIADGQLPSNTGAGYVIRRILRRAIRYYYSFLDRKEPLIYLLLDGLVRDFSDVFPELSQQKDFIQKIILEEEKSFLLTLQSGLKRFDQLRSKDGILDGRDVFDLYDTYGFPKDLTALLASERGLKIDEQAFEQALSEQKDRSRKDAARTVGDWITVHHVDTEVEFIGYDHLSADALRIMRYRNVQTSDAHRIEALFDITPFYPEGGGQVGDQGYIQSDKETIRVLDTQRENDLIIHVLERIPTSVSEVFQGIVDGRRRHRIENNHSATHLLHAALRKVLGDHVSQKGSYLDDDGLRFDFSHFEKMTNEQIAEVERTVNEKIEENISLQENRSIALEEAKKAGAMMFFGEKYGETVRMVTFDPNYSIELCGGCHVQQTSLIQYFKIISESSVAAGVRRIEAKTGAAALDYMEKQLQAFEEIKTLFKSPKNISDQIEQLKQENKRLQKAVAQQKESEAQQIKTSLKNSIKILDNGLQSIITEVDLADNKLMKQILFELEREIGDVVIFIGAKTDNKASLMGIASKSLVDSKNVHIGQMIRPIAKHIQGGGGGQPNFASAGGSSPQGLRAALDLAAEQLSQL